MLSALSTEYFIYELAQKYFPVKRHGNMHVCGFMHNLQFKRIDAEHWVSIFCCRVPGM